jgi:glycosyltransferase involved in cell wall biosynthesis
MKVLLAAHQFFPESRAGTEVLTLGLARALSSRGHEVAVFAAKRSSPFTELEPGEVEDYTFEDVPVRRAGRPQESSRRPYRLNYDNPETAESLADYAREFRPNVVHFMHLQGLSAAAIPAVKALGLPAVYTATDFWAICPVVDLRRHDGAMCTGPDPAHCPRCLISRQPPSRANSLALKTPGALWKGLGAMGYRLPSSRLPAALRQVGELGERPDFIRERVNGLGAILAPTRLMREMLVRNGVRRDLVRLSPYGIDASRIRRRDGGVHSPVRFAFVGTLSPHKAPDLPIRAVRDLPDAGLVLDIYGPDREEWYREELEHLAAGDPRIAFRGAFSQEELGEILSDVDVLVVPSRWYENAPVVILEAFAAGVTVVATDLGGMSEVVEHGKNGLLFGLDDVEDLARALERLAREPETVERLRNSIEAPRTVEDVAEEAEGVYRQLLERPGIL